MKNPSIVPALCAAAFSFCVSAAAQDAKTYQLKLERPDKVGDKSHEEIRSTMEKSQRLRGQGGVIKEESEDTRITLSGVLEVLEVSSKGKIAKLKFTVEKFTRQDEDGPEQEPLKSGTVVTGTAVEGREKNKFEVEGKEVDDKTGKVLRHLLTMSGASKKPVDDDVIFGSKEPQAPGSEWKMDSKVFVDSLPDEMPFKLTPEDVAGKVKFPAVKTVDGIESCQIQMAVMLKPDSVDGLPPGFKADKMEFNISGEKLAPVDPALIIPYEKTDQKTDVSGSFNSPAGPLTLSIYQRSVRERKSKTVK